HGGPQRAYVVVYQIVVWFFGSRVLKRKYFSLFCISFDASCVLNRLIYEINHEPRDSKHLNTAHTIINVQGSLCLLCLNFCFANVSWLWGLPSAWGYWWLPARCHYKTNKSPLLRPPFPKSAQPPLLTNLLLAIGLINAKKKGSLASYGPCLP